MNPDIVTLKDLRLEMWFTDWWNLGLFIATWFFISRSKK